MTIGKGRSRVLVVHAAVVCTTLAAGCDSGPALAPVSGTVTLDGKPLPFGVVNFQPDQGQGAQATIEAGGAFTLSTFKLSDGAIVGRHRISVKCYQGHDPAYRAGKKPEGISLGKSLIPPKFSRVGTSGLAVDVPPEGLSGYELKLGG
ncbi:MAG: hypothetical protein AAGJ46_03690 [Planctomycetota bacterium]